MVNTSTIKIIELQKSEKGKMLHNIDKDLESESICFGDIIISDIDGQGYVYADWSSLDDTDFFDKEFDHILIEGVSEGGIRINGYFIACYNEMNGYYCDELKLKLKNTVKGFL